MIKVQKSREMPIGFLRTMVYGNTRSGKTSFAATATKPVFLSIGIEGGDKTLRLFDVDIIEIKSSKDMHEAVDLISKNPGKWETVVVDSLTFYQDLFLSELTTRAPGRMLQQRDWGLLDLEIMKWLMPSLHNLPINVIWICLAQLTKDDNSGSLVRGEPMAFGKCAQKLPATTDLILYTDTQTFLDPQTRQMTTQFFLRAQPYGVFVAGGRFGPLFEATIPPDFKFVLQKVYSSTQQTQAVFTKVATA